MLVWPTSVLKFTETTTKINHKYITHMSAAYKLRKGSASPAMNNMLRRESKSGSKTKEFSSLYAIALTLIYKVGIHKVNLCTPTLPFPTHTISCVNCNDFFNIFRFKLKTFSKQKCCKTQVLR